MTMRVIPLGLERSGEHFEGMVAWFWPQRGVQGARGEGMGKGQPTPTRGLHCL